MLSHPLPVIALVGRYPTNKLISHRPLLKRPTCAELSFPRRGGGITSGISPAFAGLFRTSGQVANVLLTRSPLSCLAAARHSETQSVKCEAQNFGVAFGDDLLIMREAHTNVFRFSLYLLRLGSAERK